MEAALGTLTIECSLLALEAIEEAGTWLAGGGLMRVASTLLLIEEAGKWLAGSAALLHLIRNYGPRAAVPPPPSQKVLYHISWNCHQSCPQCVTQGFLRVAQCQ